MSVTVVALAAAAARVPPIGVGLAVIAATSPRVAVLVGAIAAGVRWIVVRRTTPGRVDEARLFLAVASELHGGASLRRAVATAATAEPGAPFAAVARAAQADPSDGEVAARLERAVPSHGRRAGLAFRLAADTGAGAAAVFSRMAQRAEAAAEADRERDALTAQARLSAAVVGGAPLAVLGLLAVSGRLGSLTSAGWIGVSVAAAGLVLIGTGVGVVGVLLRRAR